MEFGLLAAAYGWTPDVVSRLTLRQLLVYSGVARSMLTAGPLSLAPQLKPGRGGGQPGEPKGRIITEDHTDDFTVAFHRLKEKTGKGTFQYPVVFAEMKAMQKERDNARTDR